jgi:thioredoxin 1
MALEFTDSNFKSEVLDSAQLSVIDFWAEWCGPCRAIGPVIEELAKDYEGKVKIGKVNVDHNPQISMDYGITSIPAILFVKGRIKFYHVSGIQGASAGAPSVFIAYGKLNADALKNSGIEGRYLDLKL